MIIPQEKLEDYCETLIEKCHSSRRGRIEQGNLWKQYFFNGTDQGRQAPYNLCYPHIDRTSSYLFSPSDVNFRLHSATGESSKSVPKDWSELFASLFQSKKQKPQQLKWNDWAQMGSVAAHFLNAEFFRSGVNSAFAQALDWSLVKGSTFVKIVWESTGLAPYIVQPEMMGVLREDICGLDRQEAFVHTTYITLSQFIQKVKNYPGAEEMIKKVKKRAAKSKPSEQYDNDFMHQVIVGGIATANAPTQNLRGSAQIFGAPIPKLSPDVKRDLLICHEIWIQDDERDDWTTIQMIEPDIIIEGKMRRQNLSGIKGENGFRQICANPVDGYFWGMSELMPLKPLQDMANTRVSQINRALRRRSRPAWAIGGASGDAEQIRKTMDTPDGMIVEQGPGMKVEKMQPDNPTDMYENLKSTVEMFDNVAGFSPVMSGQGESGVRSQGHAETLVRTASPRMRDRALMIERQCSDVGDFCFKMLQAKEARAFVTRAGDEFLLSQLPDDMKVVVDSHSSSPAFSEDNRMLAYQLAKLGAIDSVSLIEMTHPPMEEVLVERAREKAEMEAKMIAEHPELLHGKGKKK